MKNLKINFICLFLLAIVSFTSCSKDEIFEPQLKDANLQYTQLDLKAGNTQGVIMQAFYWDVPMGGTWWGNVQDKISSWSSAGITGIWLPPASKGASGPYSMGYDPCDYFDFGDYDQMGTVETRFGNKSELQSLINTAHNAGIKVYADIVMNHCYGGSSEYNPNTGGYTSTAFSPASGIFGRGYNDFHPSTYETSDAGVWSNYPDFCHANPWVKDGLWESEYSVAKYYKNTLGFDGWRFDWVNGYSPSYVKNFVSSASGFAVTEYWGSVSEIQSCINASGVSSFDFPTMYAMKEAFNNNNLSALQNWEMLCRSNPSKAVTFVSNHDVNEISSSKKMLAYAFILAHEGTPCIFYSDYESLLDKDKLNTLIWINKNLASGSTTVLYADNDEYIAKMNGTPGLIIYINNSGSNLSRQVSSDWSSKNIHDFANNWGTDYSTDASGNATIWAPSYSFSIWSQDGESTSTTTTTTTTSSEATITLRMLKDVTYGYSLFFTGNNSALTNWSSGVEGSWNDGNYWTTTITVPTGEAVEWKVRKGTTGGSGDTWESGSNHVIDNPVDGTIYTETFNGGF